MSGAKIIEGLKEAVELAREGKAMREPPKRWKNWWQAADDGEWAQCRGCGEVFLFGPGEWFTSHCLSFASRDLAETAAQRAAELGETPEYLGAYPEGERP